MFLAIGLGFFLFASLVRRPDEALEPDGPLAGLAASARLPRGVVSVLGQGQVRDGQMFVRQGNFHVSGEQIEKRGQADYFIKHGSFTTCDGEIPDWKFTAKEVDVDLGGREAAECSRPSRYSPFSNSPPDG